MTQLVHPCLPSAFCIGYGGSINPNNQLCIGSFSSSFNSNSLMVAASGLSPPSSPSSSQSSHSLELFDSSPPCSSLAETFPHDLWAVNAPTFGTPPSFDHNFLAQATLSTRKRAAAAASSLEELSHLEASPMPLPKRLCNTTAWDCNRACSSRDASTSVMLNEINTNSHDNALISGDFGPSMEDGGALCTDLEDVLDLLLQDAEAPRAQSSPIGHGSSVVDWEDELKRACKPSDCNYSGMQKGAGEARTTLQELLSGQHWINTRAPYSFEDLKQASSAHHQQQYSRRWAGPTLLDIESALALTGSPASATSHPSISSPLGEPRKSYWSIRDILKEETATHTCKEEPLLEEDDRMTTWRRLHKRNHVGPRHTVKIQCEEAAVSDGYRWRKYGQKSIKNSPYPRSYYRCSSNKCSVKKQVERCIDDAGILLVTYEGIHLHYMPNALRGPPSPSPPPPYLGIPPSPLVVVEKKDPHTRVPPAYTPLVCGFTPPSPPTNPM